MGKAFNFQGPAAGDAPEDSSVVDEAAVAADDGTTTPAGLTDEGVGVVELSRAGDGRFEGPVTDGSFTVLSLSDADAAALGGAVKVTIEAAE